MYSIVMSYLFHTFNSMARKFIFHKIFLLLGYSQVANSFPRLKSRAKMNLQEEIWQVMCNDHFDVPTVADLSLL